MRSNKWAVVFALLNAALVGLAQQVSAGEVPIPREWAWLGPVLVAVITALSPYLKLPPSGSDLDEYDEGGEA